MEKLEVTNKNPFMYILKNVHGIRVHLKEKKI